MFGFSRSKILDYGVADRLKPIWQVGFLTYQNGLPKTPRVSITGPGIIPARQYAGWQQPTVHNYGTRSQSLTGGGKMPVRPGFLTALFGGKENSA